MLATRVNNITGLAIDTKTETMATSSDYLKLADETKDVILEYAVQDWPVVKNSVSSFNDSHQYVQLVARIIAMLQFALDRGGEVATLW